MYHFDRPIIILSAPRSGSTLLFEVLSKNNALMTIGGESHALIEKIPSLNIAYRGFSSNALNQQDIDINLRQHLLQRFSDEMLDSEGQRANSMAGTIFRFLEKTPKNSLRVDFLNVLFPDALFIYLVRDPKENISSIMQAWQSNKFVTYPNLPGWNKRNWSLLLPEKWQTLNGETLESIAAFQWQEANNAIINSLKKINSARWCMVSYEQLVNQTEKTIERLCHFSGIEFTEELAQICSQALPHSRYTISAPKADKWLANYSEIKKVWPSIETTICKINQCLGKHGLPVFDSEWHYHEMGESATGIVKESGALNDKKDTNYKNVTRNSLCPCGSGKRFKQCHGALR
ncbi:sulfotransferase family protein [Shewanella goraebulensis]|uniref:sulfotransferase family protein n=1 Tax=Shewanella goraebulensis TaxID=3050637 RepID=UPI002550D718|nr:sulfotransferase [Shewanella goraebulensis]